MWGWCDFSRTGHDFSRNRSWFLPNRPSFFPNRPWFLSKLLMISPKPVMIFPKPAMIFPELVMISPENGHDFDWVIIFQLFLPAFSPFFNCFYLCDPIDSKWWKGRRNTTPFRKSSSLRWSGCRSGKLKTKLPFPKVDFITHFPFQVRQARGSSIDLLGNNGTPLKKQAKNVSHIGWSRLQKRFLLVFTVDLATGSPFAKKKLQAT